MYLIGLTGNIASGKSSVRQMLEQLGARAIDADALAHAVIMKGTPAWRTVVDAFGLGILRPNGQVDRQKLGAVVFNDPAKLAQLESIVHPAVSTQLALLLRQATEEIVVVEAVKLIEAGLHLYCDAVWVVTTSPAEAKRRLMQDRKLSEADAQARLRAQPPLEEKLKSATIVIDNAGNIESTRVQVVRAFAMIRPENGSDKAPMLSAMLRLKPTPSTATVRAEPPTPAQAAAPRPIHGEAQRRETGASASFSKPAATSSGIPVTVRRARPGDIGVLASLLAQAEGSQLPLSRAETLRRSGKWGYWMAEAEGGAVALAAWRAENLVALMRDLWAPSPELAMRIFPPLFGAIEQEAQALQCEAAAVMTNPANEPLAHKALVASGYAPSTLDQMHKLWRGVVKDELHEGETLYFKRLREEMVTKPI